MHCNASVCYALLCLRGSWGGWEGFLGRLGGGREGSWEDSGGSGAALGRSPGTLSVSWVVLGAPLGPLGSVLGSLGASWCDLRGSWRVEGPLLGGSWGAVGSLLGGLEGVLGRSWSLLGRSWAVIGGIGESKVHLSKICSPLGREQEFLGSGGVLVSPSPSPGLRGNRHRRPPTPPFRTSTSFHFRYSI